jgi:hypothetical protein
MIRQRSTRQRSEILPPIVGTPVPTFFPNFLAINKPGQLPAIRIPRIGGESTPHILSTLRNDPAGCARLARPDSARAYRSWSFPRWNGPATPEPFGCHNRLPAGGWQKCVGMYEASRVSSVSPDGPPHAPLAGSPSREDDAGALVRRRGPCRAGPLGTHIARPILGRRWGICAPERTAGKLGRTHLQRVALVMEQDETPDPSDVTFLRAEAVMTDAHGLAHAVEQARRSGWYAAPRCFGFRPSVHGAGPPFVRNHLLERYISLWW